MGGRKAARFLHKSWRDCRDHQESSCKQAAGSALVSLVLFRSAASPAIGSNAADLPITMHVHGFERRQAVSATPGVASSACERGVQEGHVAILKNKHTAERAHLVTSSILSMSKGLLCKLRPGVLYAEIVLIILRVKQITRTAREDCNCLLSKEHMHRHHDAQVPLSESHQWHLAMFRQQGDC